MKKLLVSLTLIWAPAFGDDPYQLLPKKTVNIHATMDAYTACFAVAKILGVDVFYAAGLTSPLIKLNFDDTTGAKAFDFITAIAHKTWTARPSPYNAGRALVVVNDPPPALPERRR